MTDEPDLIIIGDHAILAAGCPPDNQDHVRWHGAMIRVVVAMIREDRPTADWDYLRRALDVLTRHAEAEILPATTPRYTTANTVDDNTVLSQGCPPEAGEAQQQWADSMAMGVLGLIISYTAQADWNELRRALRSFTKYVQSESGPLTWTV